MEEILIKCTYDGKECMTVDYHDGEFGFDMFDNGRNDAGILVSREDAWRLMKFLQRKLEESE